MIVSQISSDVFRYHQTAPTDVVATDRTNDQNHESVDKERANVPNAFVAFVQIALTLNACARSDRAILFTGKKNAVEAIVFTKLQPHFPPWNRRVRFWDGSRQRRP